MLYLDEKQVQTMMNMAKALPIIREGYIDDSNDAIFYVDRITLPVRGNDSSCIWLPACYREKPFFGIKYAASFPSNAKQNIPTVISQISLYSADTGNLLGIIEANYLTAIKTGGAAGVATDVMARQDAKTLGIIGTGIQAFTQVLAIQEVRALDEVIVYDLNPDVVAAFIKQIEAVKNRSYRVTIAKSANDCAAASDIISTCTPSNTPVFDGTMLKQGTHVNAIGSFTPFMQEIDLATVAAASKIVTEHVTEMLQVAGDIIPALEQKIITLDAITGSVGDVLTHKVKGRETAEEITLYESNGSGVLDVALATSLYLEATK